MKRFTAIILMASITMGLWASTDGNTERYQYSVKELAYEIDTTIQIEPSDEIITIFEDNDVDGIYLKSDADRRMITLDVIEDIKEVLDDDTDDVTDLIHSQLKTVLQRGKVENSYMILGNYMFSASLDYLQ